MRYPASMAERAVAVVGAGLTGLVAALRLAQQGFAVKLFERYPRAGGLVATFRVEGVELECFYHHLFTTDSAYVALARELGLEKDILWLPATMGIYSQGKLWDFGTLGSLLRFSPLSWLDKLRFGASVAYLTWAQDPALFENVTAEDWIRRWAGERVWQHVWGPLLEQKFAEQAGEIAMAWLWRKVYLRARSRSLGGERLGYLRGSFGKLVEALVEKLASLGAELALCCAVKGLYWRGKRWQVVSSRGEEAFPAVLFTGAPAELAQVLDPQVPEAYRRQLTSLRSTHALCVVLELDRPLTSYYWLNIADASFPFGGVIEHTNLLPPAVYGGTHVVYLSKYLFSHHPAWTAPKGKLLEEFLPFLPQLNSAFSPNWIQKAHVFRAAHAQPVVPCGYSRLLPPLRTPLPGLYHCCMAQIYPEDRGQNYAVREGEKAASLMVKDWA